VEHQAALRTQRRFLGLVALQIGIVPDLSDLTIQMVLDVRALFCFRHGFLSCCVADCVLSAIAPTHRG
jgi:hypothetical protein